MEETMAANMSERMNMFRAKLLEMESLQKDIEMMQRQEAPPAPAAAEDPAAALKSARQAPDFDLVISDVVMPGEFSSREMAETLQAERPDLALVLTVPEDSLVTMDWREDRVRVFVDAQGVVCREPTCG